MSDTPNGEEVGASMRDVVFVMNQEGDWCAIYINGELYYEGHEIPTDVWVTLVGGRERYDDDGKAGPYLEVWGGRFPPTWAEVEEVLGEL